MTSGTSSGIVTSTRAPSRSGERTRPTAPGGSPACSSAGRRTSSTSTVTVPSAAPPVRRTAVLRLFSSWPATSSATFGRASKFAPTVPIGIRRSLTRRPFSSVHEPISRSSGSISATASTCSARLSTRASSRRSRSSIPSSMRSDRRLAVGCVRREDLCPSLPHEHGRALRAEETASSVRLAAARRASRASSSTDSRSPATAATPRLLGLSDREALRADLRVRRQHLLLEVVQVGAGRPDPRSASPSAGRGRPRRATT